MNPPLIMNSNYVYNPTSHWMNCTIESGDQYFSIKNIPPRSVRYFPSSYRNPSISHVNVSSVNEGRMLTPSPSTTILGAPIILHTSTIFEGTADLETGKTQVTITASINEELFKGWFIQNKNLILLLGKINTKTHEVDMDMIFSSGVKYKRLKGTIDQGGQKLFLNVSIGSLSITAAENIESSKLSDVDELWTGSYMAFQNRDGMQLDLYIDMKADSAGFLEAEVEEGRKRYKLIGCKSSTEHLALLTTEDGTTIYSGEYTGDANDLTITGNWREGPQTDSFAFFKSQR